jgi:hypothetical protein
MRVVHVGVDTEEALQDGFDDGEKALGEGHPDLQVETTPVGKVEWRLTQQYVPTPQQLLAMV